MNITELTAVELSAAIKSHKISVLEAVEASLALIHKNEDKYHCYITLLEEEAKKEALEVQKKIDAGELEDSMLAGVCIAVKDNICTKGIPTTCGSQILENFVPVYDATVVEQLKKAGMIIIGKTNMDEFAMGSTTETSYFGPTYNPWNQACVPGGSSGGSAAGVASKEALIALGSDTGGSIRQPSAYCGVVGLKPTYGMVSRYGLVAYASSLDQIGPIGSNVEDCAALLDVIAKKDDKDATSVGNKNQISFYQTLKDKKSNLRIGIPKGYLGEGLDEEVKQAILDSVKVFEKLGATVEMFDLDAVEYAIPSYYVLACAEASSNLSRFDGVKYGFRAPEFDNLSDMYKTTRQQGFGNEVKRRMLIGAFVLSSGYYDAYYNKAQKVRMIMKQAFDRAFASYDLILGPTAPTVAPEVGKSLSDPLKMYLSDIYTVAVNLVGLPALSMPCKTNSNHMPIGLQLIGPHFGEQTILQAAYAYENACGTKAFLKERGE